MSREAINAFESSKVVALIDYFAIFTIIFFSNTVWSRLGWFGDHISTMRVAILFVPVVLLLIKVLLSRRAVFDVPFLLYSLLSALCFCIYVFLGSNWISAIVAFGPYVVYSLYFALVDDFFLLAKRFVSVTLAFAGVSLLFFLFGTVLHVVSSTGPVAFVWDWLRTVPGYYNLHYETQAITELFYTGVRNTGVFVEAPMYVYLLSFALAWNVLGEKGPKWISAILAVSIVTTFSTTGYVVLLIVVAMGFFSEKSSNRYLEVFRKITIPLLVIAAVVLAFYVVGAKISTGSYGIRSDHLSGCLTLFVNSFPLGVGFGDTQTFYSLFSYDQGLSVGFAYFIAQGGLPACFIFMLPWVYSAYASVRLRNWRLLAFVIVVFWVFFVTQITAVSSIMCLFLFGLISRMHRSKMGYADLAKGERDYL